MKIPFSSELPDAVQKLLGLPGGAGELKEALLGASVCAIATWGLIKLVRLLNHRSKS
jgi:hypothetical protein